MKIPKEGIFAKVFWRDVTCHHTYSEERGWKDMVQKCNIGLLQPGVDPRVVRILSEWDVEHTCPDDAYDLVLTKDALDEIIPLTEKECLRIKEKRKRTKKK